MKKLTILSALAIVLTLNSQAQEKTQAISKFYFQAGGGSSSNNGTLGEYSVHAVLRKNWMIGLSIQGMSMNPKNLPSDYKQGLSIFFFIPIPDPMPEANMNVVSFTTGKCLPVSRTVWFSTEAGVSVVTGDEIKFARQTTYDFNNPIADYSPSNYSTSSEKKTTMGGMLKADINWAFCRYVGLGLSAHANLNSIQSTTGIEFKLIIGNLAKKKTK